MTFSTTKFLRSFIHAGRGVVTFLRLEQNARLHAGAIMLVLAAGCILRITRWEWVALILSIGMVLAAEALNTAIERLCDMIQPDRDPRVKVIKDLAAAGVLLASLAALAVGLCILGPRVLECITPVYPA